MEWISFGHALDLLLLILLQAVLGFDNLLYISLESQRAPKHLQAVVRFWGILIAVGLRIGLLFLLINVVQSFQSELFSINIEGIITASFNVHALIVLLGGCFILYTAMKEIMHMMSLEVLHGAEREPKPVWQVVAWIVAMNVVFSFDSILSAMAITDAFIVMALAIVIGGILMIALADRVSEFLQKNRMYEVLGLFVLFLVGVMLITEGGHLAHMMLWDNEITQMSKTTFYFILAILIISDVVQSRYQRKLNALKRTSPNQ